MKPIRAGSILAESQVPADPESCRTWSISARVSVSRSAWLAEVHCSGAPKGGSLEKPSPPGQPVEASS